jgi:hypothetical protein
MSVIGRSPDQLSIPERFELSGKFMALEVYTPKTIPLRRIEAIADTAAECVRQLADRGLDPRQFEFVRITPPY